MTLLAAAFAGVAGIGWKGALPSYVAIAATVFAALALFNAWYLTVRARGAARAAAAAEDEARRERAPKRPVELLDPTTIGVDAAVQTILDGGRVPAYVSRNVDEQLDNALVAAITGEDPWLIVVTGPSKVGKSRALFEALKRSSRREPLSLIAPQDSDALSDLLQEERHSSPDEPREVLWLDDLEPFLNTGVRLATLARWRAVSKGGLVVATLGGKGSELIADTKTGELATFAKEVLSSAREISLDVTTDDEISGLRSRTSPEEFASLKLDGLAAYLVAAPALKRKLSTRRHEAGDDACPEGRAVVDAAVDWARCGRTDAVSEQVLKQLWPSYLHPSLAANDDTFDRALAWALRPVAATIALLRRVPPEGFQPFDYVVRLINDAPEAASPRDAAWQAATHTPTVWQAMSVGEAAYDHGRLDVALEAFETARTASDDNIAATAGHNVGVVLGRLDRREEQLAVFDAVLNRFDASPMPPVQAMVAVTMQARGMALAALGRRDEAIAAFDALVARFGTAPSTPVLEAIAGAMLNKASLLVATDLASVVEVCDDLLLRLSSVESDTLDQALAAALEMKAAALAALDRPDEVLDTLDELAMVFDQIAPDRTQMARAALSRGTALATLDRFADAIEAYDDVIALSDDDAEGQTLRTHARRGRDLAREELEERRSAG